MDTFIVSIDSNGDMSQLVSPSFPLLVDGTIRRASHVEPTNIVLRWVFHLLRTMYGGKGRIAAWTREWPIVWRVNLTPINGPIIPIDFTNRFTAIQFEISWINDNIF